MKSLSVIFLSKFTFTESTLFHAQKHFIFISDIHKGHDFFLNIFTVHDEQSCFFRVAYLLLSCSNTGEYTLIDDVWRDLQEILS